VIAAIALGVISIRNMSSARALEDFSGMGFWAGTMWRGFLYFLLLLLYSRAVLLRDLIQVRGEGRRAQLRSGEVVVPITLLSIVVIEGIAVRVLFF
jgi:hypothetical protein